MTLGLPASADERERRFPLTPEGVAQLVGAGVAVVMQQGAADCIHYADAAYVRAGAEIAPRSVALGCDVVVHLSPLLARDVARMQRGATLLSLANIAARSPEGVQGLLRRHVTAIAIDLIRPAVDDAPFADALAEVEGAGAIALAVGALADGKAGKGILLGGIAGVPPCEVTIIGSGLAACAAARAAAGLGAVVRMFDGDIRSLRRALWALAPIAPVASTLNSHVLEGALRAADVLVVTGDKWPLGCDDLAVAKRGVLIYDLTGGNQGNRNVGGREIHTDVGQSVARSSAMALSNTLVAFIIRHWLSGLNTPLPALQASAAIQRATLTYMGRVVNPELARVLGMRSVDISIYLSLS